MFNTTTQFCHSVLGYIKKTLFILFPPPSQTGEFWMQLKGTTRRVTSCGWVQTAGVPKSLPWLARRESPREPSQSFPNEHLWMVRMKHRHERWCHCKYCQQLTTAKRCSYTNAKGFHLHSFHTLFICHLHDKWRELEGVYVCVTSLIDQIKGNGRKARSRKGHSYSLTVNLVGSKFLSLGHGGYPDLLPVRDPCYIIDSWRDTKTTKPEVRKRVPLSRSEHIKVSFGWSTWGNTPWGLHNRGAVIDGAMEE